MRTNMLKTSPLASAAAVAAALAATALPAVAQAPATPPAPTPAAAPASPPPNYNWQYNGFFDGYYMWQFANPKAANSVDDAFYTRTYDFRTNTPTLALGELVVYKNPKPGGFGFKSTLGSGDVATINGGGGLESRFQSLLQAYGTYAFPGGGGIDFGKFYTPIGYEVTESNGNNNETHSIPYSFIPFYHFGARAYTPSFQGWVLTGYVVQAVYNTAEAGVENDTRQASFVGNITWNDPKNKWTFVEDVGIGTNKFNLALGGIDPTKNKVTVSDTNLMYNLTSSQSLGLDYTYASTNPDNNNDSFKATDTGWAGYYKQILTSKTDFAVRYSGGTFKSDAPGSSSAKPWEATLTYEIHPTPTFTTRLEYQHSGANFPIYLDSNSLPTKKSQDILEVAGNFTFSS